MQENIEVSLGMTLGIKNLSMERYIYNNGFHLSKKLFNYILVQKMKLLMLFSYYFRKTFHPNPIFFQRTFNYGSRINSFLEPSIRFPILHISKLLI